MGWLAIANWFINAVLSMTNCSENDHSYICPSILLQGTYDLGVSLPLRRYALGVAMDHDMEDIALLALAAWLYYRFSDNLLFVVLIYAGLWYVSGGIVIPAVCLACSAIAYGGYRLAHWQPAENSAASQLPDANNAEKSAIPIRQLRNDIPSFDSVMAQWDEKCVK